MNLARKGTALIVAATIFILAAVVAAIYIEPPQAAREKRLDDRRVRDLVSLEARVNEYWNRQKKLPQSLSELTAAGLQGADLDPETNAAYQYVPTGERSYRLCASFSSASADNARRDWPARDVEWTHARGQQCFDRNVRPRPS